ncbi:hypothetical protein GCM10009786_18990 [Leucobacter alluvii]|uniref:DUF998 domain-containing protein n=1 Tax=Leucobacter alluvii TaxID=340321 RepID=A0ABP5MXW2_9MICO
MKRYRVGAIAWILSALVIPAQVIVALGWPSGYSVASNTISDLGVTACGEYSELGQQVREVCSPGHAIFNISMFASGALILIGAVLLYGRWGRATGRAGTIFMIVAGMSVLVVGISPWDVAPEIHDSFALMQAVSQWIAMILLAIAAGPGNFRKVTTFVVVVSAASFVIFMVALEGYEVPWLGVGGVERLSFDSLTVWTALTGVALLKSHRSSRP